jgi:UDP-N-acetylglucosamine--N-acetylmuramyl-(pentapeptide) pyrophosphoryl-undecaprenol N-acetylglucosamine transferase
MLARLAARGSALEVRHLAQDSEAPVLQSEYARGEVPAVVGSLLEPVADAYRWCDFVIARAGAGTIAELAIAGVPALLVPLRDAADDHQALNAEAFAAAGGGCWVREEHWNDEEVAGRVAAIVNDAHAWQAASSAARCLATPNAAELTVAGCESLMRGRW